MEDHITASSAAGTKGFVPHKTLALKEEKTSC
jgi:hypothetical protein